MERTEAIKLIEAGVSPGEGQIWADLGCGSGTFTLALASVLSGRNKIYAVDNDQQVLASIPNNYENISIEHVVQNFKEFNFPFNELNGIVMANSLHYVRQKSKFLDQLRQFLQEKGNLIIVEYEARMPNPWVPYPVGRDDLSSLLESIGFENITILHQMKSKYGHLIYSLTAHKTNRIKLND